ncbi:MAG: hypothetical protein LBJ46_01840, partial [Planctomycetota bacterium]|nr:hypothetical protein [Planctomycetota bacterium]
MIRDNIVIARARDTRHGVTTRLGVAIAVHVNRAGDGSGILVIRGFWCKYRSAEWRDIDRSTGRGIENSGTGDFAA